MGGVFTIGMLMQQRYNLCTTDAMQAKVTIPLHGFTPELLQGPNETFLPQQGVIYLIEAILNEK